MAFLIASAILLILVILASMLVKASFRSDDEKQAFSIIDIIELAVVSIGVGLIALWVDSASIEYISTIKFSLIGVLIGGYVLTRKSVMNAFNGKNKSAFSDFKKLSDTQSLDIIKKYEVSQISRKKSIYFFSGLLIALVFTALLVEYETFTTFRQEIIEEVAYIEEEIIDVPITEIPPPPPPKPKVTPVIQEVPDETLIEEPEIEIEPEEEVIEEEYAEPEEEVEEVIEEDNSIFNLYELQQKPEYPGGISALLSYVQSNFQVPSRDIEEGNKGRIFVQFVIEKNGSVGGVEIKRGINSRLDKEAVRVIKSLPKWKPGMNAGAPARVRYVFPITIKF